MARRQLRRILLVLSVLGLLAAAGFGVSAGLASNHRSSSPASAGSKQRPNARAETIQQCLATLGSLKARASALRKLRQDVVARRTYLYTVGHFEGHSLFVPISVSEFAYFLTEELTLGAITPRQVVQAVQTMKQMTAHNLVALNGYIGVADSAVQRQRAHCASLGGTTTTTTPKPPPPPPAAGTFTLQPSLTKVSNPNSNELTIDATAGTAFDDHTGKNGGAGNGGDWQVDYSWKVPQTITPGKTTQITIGLSFKSVNPSQPLGFQITAFMPDFAQAVQAHWPETPSASKTFTIPVAADQKDSSEIVVTIGVLSAGVQYHYRK
jgi:hypothetical protein